MTVVLWIFAVILIIIGFAGILLPVIPGTPLMFCGFLTAAWIDNFQKVGWISLIVLGILTLLSLGVDILAASIGVKRVGASRTALAGAAIGTFIGFFFGIAGIIIGSFLGAVAGEYMSRQDMMEAGKVGFGAWLGLVIGAAIKLGLAFTMIVIFIMAFIL